MSQAAKCIEQGSRLHQAGRLPEAEALYRQALILQPSDATALYHLGWLHADCGNYAAAIASFQQALRYAPDYAEVHAALGDALYLQGGSEEALVCFQNALAYNPSLFEAHQSLGVVLHSLNRFSEAVESFRRAIALDPEAPEVRVSLGVALRSQRRFEEAADAFRAAIGLHPDCFEAHLNLAQTLTEAGRLTDAIGSYEQAAALRPQAWELRMALAEALQAAGRGEEALAWQRKALTLEPDNARIHNNLSLTLRGLGRGEEAEAALRAALALQPDYAEAHANLGSLLQAQKRLDEAITAHRRAVALRPERATFHSNLGNALFAFGRREEALECHLRAVALAPNLSPAHSDLGVSLQAADRWDEALACHRRAVALGPNHAEAHFNLGIALLTLGDFAQGWPEYEWRLKTEQNRQRPLARTGWNGEPAPHKTLLVLAEQGLGDTIQFVRYLPLVKARFQGRVVFACQPELVALLKAMEGADETVARDSDGAAPALDFDATIPLLSLPGLFGTKAETIPAPNPSLSADEDRRQAWQARIGEAPGLKVGLCWAGNPAYSRDRDRSCALADFAPLTSVPGATFYSLQKGAGAEQASEAPEGMNLIDLNAALTDFTETAAALVNLDLLISVDTSVAHLAGALGEPTWLALPFSADWRWQRDRLDSPWYPALRLFRQSRYGDWNDIFLKMAGDLRAAKGERSKGIAERAL